MKYRLLVTLFLLAASGLKAHSQAWSTFLDSSRAIDWTNNQVGFTIPSYTVNCSVQPSLTANSSSAASANATAIQNALNSCDSTHNVVNIPAGSYYVTSISFGSQGHQVLRGAGPNSTTIIPTSGTGCSIGTNNAICMSAANGVYAGNSLILPPSGPQQCSWTAGYSQKTTSITLSSCGGAPVVGDVIDLDQANDSSDTGGVYVCDVNINGCGYEGSTGGNNNGRFISGATHSEQQLTLITGVTSLGGGSYTVTISPGVYFTNIRSSQSPGAWWFQVVQNDGVENLTLDGGTMSSGSPGNYGNIGMQQCYQCWVRNVRSLNAGRYHIDPYLSFQTVIRNNYFYGAAGTGSESYTIELDETAASLIENNIFQQVTVPTISGANSGNVIDYNFSIYSNYGGTSSPYIQQAYEAHNAGNNFNLFEGNDFIGITSDDAWGSSPQDTYFRNFLYGWQNGKSANTIPIVARDYVRTYNIVGNVMGEPGYHTGYQTYATSTGAISGGPESLSIYSIGLASQDSCNASSSLTVCDPLAFNTLMRWGNYDTVNNAVRWNSTEASPGAVAYVNANFTSSYFSSLAHTLPNSLYYSSQPSWWTSSVSWPPIGPDVSSGNLGICSGGTYAGGQAISSGQCTGGTLTTAWASHANAIPALVCYLSVMNGPPDGSGSALSFDANTCYSSAGTGNGTAPAAPTALVGTAN